jgi:hypothetical protein
MTSPAADKQRATAEPGVMVFLALIEQAKSNPSFI